MRASTLAEALTIVLISGTLVLAQGSGSSRVQSPQGSGSSRVQDQGSGSSRAAPSSGASRTDPRVPATKRPRTAAEFAASFWSYMNNPKAPFHKWGTPGKTKTQIVQAGTGAPQPSPHGEYGKTYLNNVANRDLQKLPMGSVVAREEYGADGKTVEYVTVMYRAKAADPNNANWYWMMFKPDGTLARAPQQQGGGVIAGRVQTCIQCHQGAGGKDYMFLNDRPVPGTPPAAPAGSGSSRR